MSKDVGSRLVLAFLTKLVEGLEAPRRAHRAVGSDRQPELLTGVDQFLLLQVDVDLDLKPSLISV